MEERDTHLNVFAKCHECIFCVFYILIILKYSSIINKQNKSIIWIPQFVPYEETETEKYDFMSLFYRDEKPSSFTMFTESLCTSLSVTLQGITIKIMYLVNQKMIIIVSCKEHAFDLNGGHIPPPLQNLLMRFTDREINAGTDLLSFSQSTYLIILVIIQTTCL